MDIVIIYFIKY